MQITIDEREQAHLYSCLLVGNAEFLKVKKSLAKLNRDDETIDEEIGMNAALRRVFNPAAEDEARARARAKTDPAQMDLEEAASSGETGGSTRRSLTTGPRMTPAELRDALFDIGYAIALSDVTDWETSEFDTVVDWVGAVVAANNGAGRIPDEPETLVSARPMSPARLTELLAAGPYVVRDMEPDDSGDRFAVVETTDPENPAKTESFEDRRDAELFAADENLYAIRNADLPPDQVEKWVDVGPWVATAVDLGEQGETFVVLAGREREEVNSLEEARARAARYNRSIAARASSNDVPVTVQFGDSGPIETTVGEMRELAETVRAENEATRAD